MPRSFCQEVAASGLMARCYYSDLTEFVDGPPIDEPCPAAPHPTSPFCGDSCGACPAVTDETVLIEDTACIGRNEERPLGVCVFSNEICTERDPLANIGRSPEDPISWPGVRDVACFVYQDVPFLEGQGWLTRRATCLAYRDRYPGAIDCMDHNWESFP